MLEELALAAWPAHMTVLDDGWVIRLSGGHTKRANSVTALASSTRPLTDKVAYAESLFVRHDLTPVFRLTALADAGLDGMLEARGYRRAEESVVMIAPLADQPIVADARIVVSNGVSRDWVSAYAALQHLDPARTSALQQMMTSIAPRQATAQVEENGVIVGFGLGVVDRGVIGVFEVLTHPSARRRGIARQIMAALLAWGATCGARETYLQVVATNAAAIRLYADMGYQEAYRYWYRIGG